jgi:Family of unknown function (DUF6364)
MRITLSLGSRTVKEARKIASDRGKTLTGFVRNFLEELVAEKTKSGRKQRQLNALHESFNKYSFKMGKRTWTRADLYDRS